LVVEELAPMCRAAGASLRVLNVDTNPEWQRRYGLRIPVVCGDGEELSDWPLDRMRVAGWLSQS
jgi:hypothetical protein